MIVRGVIANGGWQAGDGGDLLVRIAVDELQKGAREPVTPASLRGRTAVLVLGDAVGVTFIDFSPPAAAMPDCDDGETVDAGTTPPTVVE